MSVAVSRRRYPTDLKETAWRRIEPLLPREKPRGRRRRIDLREVVNGIHYRWSTGCTWRMLPHDFPPWATIYCYFRQWSVDGTLTRLRAVLLSRRTPRATAASN
jgi:putative transposase